MEAVAVVREDIPMSAENEDEKVVGPFEHATALRIAQLLPLTDGEQDSSVGPSFDGENVFDKEEYWSTAMVEESNWECADQGRIVGRSVGSGCLRINPWRNGTGIN